MRARAISVEGRSIAWIAATLAAGPVFAACVFFPYVVTGSGLFLLVLLSLPFAMLMGTLPIGVAILLGGELGSRWRLMRHPAIWFAVGVAGGALLDPVLSSFVPNAIGATMMTGAITALIARRLVHWVDAPRPT